MTKIKPTLSRRTLIAAGAAGLALPYLIRPAASPAQAAAPMLGAATPTHYRFRIGGFEITTLNDGAIQLGGPYPIFGMDQFPDDVAELAQKNHLPADKMIISFTPVIVNTGKEVVIFDTGNGAPRRPKAGHLASLLQKAGYTPDQVDVVAITHFHPDHIGGLMENGKPLFPNARYVMSETESDFWLHPDQASGPTARGHKLAVSNIKPVLDKTRFIDNGGDVVSGITAYSAPGHTPGHTAYHIESQGKRIFLGGDYCNHYVVSMQRPDWHVRFDMDKEQAARTRTSVLDMLASEKLLFTSYHMPFPAVGYVEKAGEGYRYVPATYELMIE